MNFEKKQLENRQLSKKEKEQLERDIKKIIELQKLNEKNGVTVRSADFIRELFQAGEMHIVQNETEEIVACFYEELLISPEETNKGAEQIFKFGGASVAENKEAREAFKDLLREQMEERGGKIKAISKTKKDSNMGKVLEKLGWIKLSFDECKEKYPEFLEAYLNKSSKPKEEYLDAEFYILSKNKE